AASRPDESGLAPFREAPPSLHAVSNANGRDTNIADRTTELDTMTHLAKPIGEAATLGETVTTVAPVAVVTALVESLPGRAFPPRFAAADEGTSGPECPRTVAAIRDKARTVLGRGNPK